MDSTFWRKQQEEPLFPELEWNKPERRNQAGKLLIIGGTLHTLTAPANAYERVTSEGIGEVKIALPDKTKRLVGATLPSAVFLPSTASGEFALEGSAELDSYTQWADTILFPGDSGRNSQTTILFEQLIKTHINQVIITRDALDSISNNAQELIDRPDTTLVASFAQFQKLVKVLGEPTAVMASMDLVQLVEFLHVFSSKHTASMVTYWQGQLLAAHNGGVSSTKVPSQKNQEPPLWRTSVASYGACYQTWNPQKPLEALTQANYQFAKTLLN